MKNKNDDKAIVVQKCPSLEELRAYVLSPDNEQIKQHLKSCDFCHTMYVGVCATSYLRPEVREEEERQLIERIVRRSETTDIIDALAVFAGLDDNLVKQFRALHSSKTTDLVDELAVYAGLDAKLVEEFSALVS